jgi:TPR repeat protein
MNHLTPPFIHVFLAWVHFQEADAKVIVSGLAAAATASSLDASFALGRLYDEGQARLSSSLWAVVGRDSSLALTRLLLPLPLPLLMLLAQGVAQSDAQALRYYEAAAVGGHADAQGALAMMYADGHGKVLSSRESS